MMTQEQLSEKTGISQGHISKILSGKRIPSWNTVKKLASATKTNPIDWFEGKIELKPKKEKEIAE